VAGVYVCGEDINVVSLWPEVAVVSIMCEEERSEEWFCAVTVGEFVFVAEIEVVSRGVFVCMEGITVSHSVGVVVSVM
jgi:hypothetical protein